MSLIRLIYVSSARTLLDQAALQQILSKAQQNNAALSITGMLLYAGGNFIQVLEGEAAKVWQLYEKIAKDPCHNDIIMLDDSAITKRAFPTWSMGFKLLSGSDTSTLRGYTDFLERKVPVSEFLTHKDEVAELLYQFAETNQR